MANSDKDILITPNSGSSSADPKIEYVGADSSGNDTITVETLYDGTKATLSFEGSAGQLFSVVNDLSSDPIFSVNDVSGIPSIEVDSDGEIRLAEFSGNVGIGISSPTELLHVDGRIKANNLTLSSLSAQNSEATAVMIDGSGIIGTRELGSNAFNSTSYLTSSSGLNASNLTSGTVPSARLSLSASDIPDLAASKITSGRFADARMPTTIGGSASTTFIGTLSGNANTASNTPVYTTGANSTHYVTFALTNGGGSSDGTGSQARLTDAGLTYNPSTNALGVGGNITVSGTVDGRDVAADGTKLDGISSGADVTPSWVPSSNPNYLTGNQTITLSGDVSGSGTTSISVTIADDSHNHVISNVDGLQTALDGKLSTTGTAANSQLLDSIDSSQFLRSDTADTASGILTYSNTQKYLGNTFWQVSSSDTAIQRADARDDQTTRARLHWYGQDSSGTNTNFRHAWYDGSAYVNVDVANQVVSFSGGLSATTVNTGQGANELYAMNQNVRTTDSPTFADLTVTGNLSITGDINSYNVTDLDVTDKTITLGVGQTEANSGSSGIIIDGSAASMLWDEGDNRWEFNKNIYAPVIYGSGAGITSLNASNLGSGTVPSARLSLSASDIPSLAASKITSGTFADARISSSSVTQHLGSYLTSSSGLNASNITSGTIATARLPNPIQLSGGNAIIKLQETDVTNSPNWWHVADGGNYSIRLNNTGTYPISINTNGTNNAVSAIVLGYNTDFSAGIDVTGNITVTGTVDGRDVATDGSKLDGISSGADVTPSWVPSSDPGYLTSSSTQSKYLRSDTSDTYSGGTLTFQAPTNGTGVFMTKALDSPDEPAILVLAGDADSEDDLAFEIRGNTTGSSVDLSTTMSSADTKFAIFQSGHTTIGYNSLGTGYTPVNAYGLNVNGTISAVNGYYAGSTQVINSSGNWVGGGNISEFTNDSGYTTNTGTVSSLSDLSITSTAAELNKLDGYTGSVTELNYLDTLHATGVTSTEFDYLDGVTSNIQTQLNGKQASSTALTTSTTFGGDVSGTYNNIAVANNSHQHSQLYENGTIDFGASYVQWTDQNGTGGTGLDGAAPRNPANGWYHNLIFNHANGNGYYSQIATGLNSSDIYFTRVQNGSAQSWQRIFADDYHPNADTLTTARTIGGVSFNGSANINLPGVNTAGNQNTSGTAAGLSGTPDISVGNIFVGSTSGAAASLGEAGIVINASTKPQILFDGGSDTNLDIAVPTGEVLQIGHWDVSGNSATLQMSMETDGDFSFEGNNIQGISNVSTSTITASSHITITGTDKQIKFTGTAGPLGLEFGDTEANPNFRIYYRTTPNTLTFENSGETAKHTFDLSGNYTAAGNITVSGTVDGRDIATDGSKLDGIESGATADQTASEILTAIKTVDGTGSGLDADSVDGVGITTASMSDGTVMIATSGTQMGPASSQKFGRGTYGQHTEYAVGGPSGSAASTGYVGNNYPIVGGNSDDFVISGGADVVIGQGGYARLRFDGTYAQFLQPVKLSSNLVDTNNNTRIDTFGRMFPTEVTVGVAPSKNMQYASSTLTIGSVDDDDFYLNLKGFGGNSNIQLDDGDIWVNGTGNSTAAYKFASNGHFHSNGDVIAYSSTLTASDRRLKENVQALENPLEKVMHLQGVRYDWKDKNRGTNQIGLIAQEVEKVVPEVVNTIQDSLGELSDMKVVNYSALVPVLIEAIKQQQETIDKLTSRINDIEKGE